MKVMGLFSIFDPSSSLMTNWASILISLSFISMGSVYLFSSQMNGIVFFLVSNIYKEMLSLLNSQKEKFLLLMLSIMVLIIFNNSLGVFSFVFTATSHLSVALALAVPLWALSVITGVAGNLKHFLIHLTPMSTPYALMPFMVCIETVSIIIRPITLSVRLAANMIAGHLLLTLLGNLITEQNKLMIPMLFLSDMLLMILESAVALIQSYVFVVLSLLYVNESL